MSGCDGTHSSDTEPSYPPSSCEDTLVPDYTSHDLAVVFGNLYTISLFQFLLE